MRCSSCRTEVADDAAFCSRCGTSLRGAPAPGSMEQRQEAALAAFERGKDARGVQCPGCGGYRMRTIRGDAEENLFWAAAFMVVGIVSLLIVAIAGDVGLVFANLSTIALVCILVGVLLFMIARWRRRPSAYECLSCGYRVP